MEQDRYIVEVTKHLSIAIDAIYELQEFLTCEDNSEYRQQIIYCNKIIDKLTKISEEFPLQF